jgi:hypothetical protein
MENINKLNTEIIKYLIIKLKKNLCDLVNYNCKLGCSSDLVDDLKNICIELFWFSDSDKNVLEGDFNLSFSDCCFMVAHINLYFLQNEDFCECYNYSNEYWVFNTYCFVYSRYLFDCFGMAEYAEILQENHMPHNLPYLVAMDHVVQKHKNLFLLEHYKNKAIYKLCNKYINNVNKKKTIKKLLHNTNLETDIIEKIIKY